MQQRLPTRNAHNASMSLSTILLFLAFIAFVLAAIGWGYKKTNADGHRAGAVGAVDPDHPGPYRLGALLVAPRSEFLSSVRYDSRAVPA